MKKVSIKFPEKGKRMHNKGQDCLVPRCKYGAVCKGFCDIHYSELRTAIKAMSARVVSRSVSLRSGTGRVKKVVHKRRSSKDPLKSFFS